MSGQQNVAFAQDLDLGLKSTGPTTIPPLTFKVKECSKASQGMENSLTESQFASQVSRPDILFRVCLTQPGQWTMARTLWTDRDVFSEATMQCGPCPYKLTIRHGEPCMMK